MPNSQGGWQTSLMSVLDIWCLFLTAVGNRHRAYRHTFWRQINLGWKKNIEKAWIKDGSNLLFTFYLYNWFCMEPIHYFSISSFIIFKIFLMSTKLTFYIRINIRDFIIYWTVHMNDEITTLFIPLCMLINIEMIIVMHCKIRTIHISILFWSEIFGEFFRQSSFHLASSTCIFTCHVSIFYFPCKWRSSYSSCVSFRLKLFAHTRSQYQPFLFSL